MEYLEIKENKISGHFSGINIPEDMDGKKYIKVNSFFGSVGDSVELYEIKKLEKRLHSVERLSDEKLIKKGLIIDNRGVFYSTDRIKPTIKISKISNIKIPEGYTKDEPKEFDKWDGLKWVEDSKLKSKTANERKVSEAYDYLRISDYKVLRAFEEGTTLDKLYPGEKKKRKDARAVISDNKE